MRIKKAFVTIILGVSIFLLASCRTAPKNVAKKANDATDSSTQIIIEQSSIIEENKEEEVSMTFEAGSLLQAVNNRNTTEVTAILGSTNYDLNETDESGNTPLLLATQQNEVEIAKLLIDGGADVNQQNQLEDSAYLFAGAEGRLEILTYILEKTEPNLKVVNRYGGNALIPAAEKGHLENVNLLLKDGRVDVDHQNNFGYTALIEAVALTDGSQVYQEIVAVLLEYGANRELRDNSGRNALEYAKEKGYGNIANLLSE